MRKELAVPKAQRLVRTDAEIGSGFDLSEIRIPRNDNNRIAFLNNTQKRVLILGEHVEVYLASHFIDRPALDGSKRNQFGLHTGGLLDVLGGPEFACGRSPVLVGANNLRCFCYLTILGLGCVDYA
jgi:hypothetical protein